MLGTPGTLISGTLRVEDLIPAFANEAARLSADNAIVGAWQTISNAQAIDWSQPFEAADHDDLIDELFDILDKYAPEGHYFGARGGDGSDFGYWPNEEGPEGLQHL